MTELSENILRVTFTKADGSQRVMVCTTKAKYLPPPPDSDGLKKAHNAEVQCVWDLEATAWRSYRLDSVISTERLSEEETKQYEPRGEAQPPIQPP